MIPVKVTKISYNSEEKNYVVLLQEISGQKSIPIIVGSFEAQAIALAIESVETPRPLTHDLICDFIVKTESTLKKIVISNLEDGVFYSKLEIESDKLVRKNIDARPSDSIVLALRMGTPILVDSKIMDEVGVIFDEKNKEVQQFQSDTKNKTVISIETLKEKMKVAIDKEEYEIAARLRDKISELKS